MLLQDVKYAKRASSAQPHAGCQQDLFNLLTSTTQAGSKAFWHSLPATPVRSSTRQGSSLEVPAD